MSSEPYRIAKLQVLKELSQRSFRKRIHLLRLGVSDEAGIMRALVGLVFWIAILIGLLSLLESISQIVAIASLPLLIPLWFYLLYRMLRWVGIHGLTISLLRTSDEA